MKMYRVMGLQNKIEQAELEEQPDGFQRDITSQKPPPGSVEAAIAIGEAAAEKAFEPVVAAVVGIHSPACEF